MTPKRNVKAKQVKSARDRLLTSDVYTDTLDAALTSAEESLRNLLPGFKPREISEAFAMHVQTHLSAELVNIKAHGHRNDDPNDDPNPNDTPETTVSLNLSAREFDTVIAALRLWQRESAHIADGDGAIADLAEERGEALTKAEIDGLCERINFAPEAECDCDDRSWYGEEHDSACPLTGKREPEKLFRNHYKCPDDGTQWVDEWSCACNDRCPTCNHEIEPYESEDITPKK